MTIDDAIRCARERAESWKLNREDCDFNNECSECATACEAEEKECEQLEEWLSELKKYKDAEEQGLLLKLPCKVGDTVYQPLIDGQINEYKVIGLVYDIVKNEWAFETATQIGLEWFKKVCYLECIGKIVFLTKEEAEQKLKEMERDTNGN